MKPGLWVCVAVVVVLTAAGGFVAWDWDPAQAQSREYADYMKEIEPPDSDQEFPVPLRPLSKTITPCRACHGPEKDFPVNVRRKEDLLMHANIRLNHGGIRLWCLDCHHPDNRNYLLPLSDGQDIPFERSFLLCGKCHGTIYRDWRHGIHGKRTGSWNGPKNYYMCVTCHDPHNPKFKPMSPMPPPEKPWAPPEVRAFR